MTSQICIWRHLSRRSVHWYQCKLVLLPLPYCIDKTNLFRYCDDMVGVFVWNHLVCFATYWIYWETLCKYTRHPKRQSRTTCKFGGWHQIVCLVGFVSHWNITGVRLNCWTGIRFQVNKCETLNVRTILIGFIWIVLGFQVDGCETWNYPCQTFLYPLLRTGTLLPRSLPMPRLNINGRLSQVWGFPC